jgi:FMN-dependent dehydrogenase
MNRAPDPAKTRRTLFRMLAASPLLATSQLFAGSLQHILAAPELTPAIFRGWLNSFEQSDDIITSDQAFNVMDFEPAARRALPPAHFGYMATGVDDDATVRANREAFSRIEIRPRRLVDSQKIDISVHLFGATWSSPIVICPVSSQRAFHPEGDFAVARAARAQDHLKILSTAATSSLEDVIAPEALPSGSSFTLRMSGRWDGPS